MTDHPDTLTAYHALKQITRGGRQATTTAAMDAMWEAMEAGKSKEEAEEIYSSFFNNKP